MWYEELDFEYDLDRLRKDVREYVFTLGDQVIQGEEFETPLYKGFGGWSLLSRNADWRDGWEVIQTHTGNTLESFFPTQEMIIKAYKYFNIAHSLEYDKPTQAYVRYIREILEQLKSLGLTPRRARVTCLKSHSKSLVHKDADTTEYMARLHLPLWSNEKCVFICEGKHLYMEPGKAYLIWANQWHQIRNDSDEDRYHIIMDVYDTKKITKHFKYEGNINELQAHANTSRLLLDETVLTQEDIDFFESVKEKFITKKPV